MIFLSLPLVFIAIGFILLAIILPLAANYSLVLPLGKGSIPLLVSLYVIGLFACSFGFVAIVQLTFGHQTLADAVIADDVLSWQFYIGTFIYLIVVYSDVFPVPRFR